MSDPHLTLAEAATKYAEAVVAERAADWGYKSIPTNDNYVAWTTASSALIRARRKLHRAALLANGVEP